jgi:hypothetical protein
MHALTPEAEAAIALARAAPGSYAVSILRDQNGRALVVLGETHIKLARAKRIGIAMVNAFDLRGVEGFPRPRVFAGRVLGVLISAPRILVRKLSWDFVKDSTIADARALKTGFTVPLEADARVPLSLHIGTLYLALYFSISFATVGLQLLRGALPALERVLSPAIALLAPALALFHVHILLLIPAIVLRRFRWNWLLHPMSAILTARDAMMVEGTVEMMKLHPHSQSALIIMGRAHVRGFNRELCEHHGYSPSP